MILIKLVLDSYNTKFPAQTWPREDEENEKKKKEVREMLSPI